MYENVGFLRFVDVAAVVIVVGCCHMKCVHFRHFRFRSLVLFLLLLPYYCCTFCVAYNSLFSLALKVNFCDVVSFHIYRYIYVPAFLQTEGEIFYVFMCQVQQVGLKVRTTFWMRTTTTKKTCWKKMEQQQHMLRNVCGINECI